MKKFAMIVFGLMMVTGVYCQSNQRTAAFNHLRYNRLDKAQEAIDKAIEHPKTINDARTWFYRGNVYLAIRLTDEEQYMNLDPKPLEKAYQSYIRALELDEKQEHLIEINERMIVVAEQYFNDGVNFYNIAFERFNNEGKTEGVVNAYKEAATSFELSGDINSRLGVMDTVAYYYSAQSAFYAEEFEVAKKYFSNLKQLNYLEPSIYRFLSEIYKAENDTTMALNMVQSGREIFPEDLNLIIEETNIYLNSNQQDKALALLQLAVKKDDTNPTLFFAIGTNFDEMGNFEEAEKNYLKAIELDPEYFDPNYNLGALYVNKAIEFMEEANTLPLSEETKYNDLKEKSDELLQNSIPYLSKADELNPDDVLVLRTLRDIYARLGMLDKLKEIDERLDK
jgi:tetratricopeptide (TPR) repeat protein